MDRIVRKTLLDGCHSLAVVPLSPFDGLATVGERLAARLKGYGERPLTVSLSQQASGVDWRLNDISAHLAINESEGVASLPTQSRDSNQMERVQGPQSSRQTYRDLPDALLRWQQAYSQVVLLTEPLLEAGDVLFPAEQIAATCQRCLLLVQAGKDKEQELAHARQLLAQTGGTLVGVLIDDRCLPSLAQRLQPYLPDRLAQGLARSLFWQGRSHTL
ncbi:hypothetical protein [Ferrimonas pelagia]